MVTAVIITWKRQHNIPRIVDSILKVPQINEILIHDNSKGENLYCYRRFELAFIARNELIYTQDDDVVNHDIEKLIEEHEGLTCGATQGYLNALNDPPYSNTNLALLGYGSLFSKKDINFGKYLSNYLVDELFFREADRIFTLFNPNKPKVIKCNIEEIDNLQHSMSGEARHLADRLEIIKRCQELA